MAKNSTTQAVIRSGPKSSAGALGHAGSVILGLPVSFDPTAVSADTGITLPEGSIVIGFQHDGGATGGTNPTFDMGISGDGDAYINEGDADAAGFVAVNGANVHSCGLRVGSERVSVRGGTFPLLFRIGGN